MDGVVDSAVALLRVETGALVWRRKAAQPWLALAHGGDVVYISSWSGQPLRPPALLRRETLDHPHRNQRVVEIEPARVEAHRASDGALLWQKSDWGLVALAQMAPQGDKVIVAARHPAGAHTLYALDAQTGAVAWTRDNKPREGNTPQQLGPTQRFVTASAEHVYLMVYGDAREAPRNQRLQALEAASGRELWSRELQNAEALLSHDGQFVATVERAQGGRSIFTVLSASDGAPVGTLALSQESRLCGLSDSGIVYIATSAGASWWLSAMRVADGAELWRTADAAPDMILYMPDALVSLRHIHQNSAGTDVSREVCAFDAQTGAALWRWRTPANPGELLRLWRRRIPEVAAGVARQAGAFVATSLTSALRARDLWQVASIARREVAVGLWRRPHVVEFARLVSGGGAVYLGTRLGLFALDVKQGHLLWYALPNTDLSNVDPATAPNYAS
jgi:outer membrane protein assembly factor BamB